MLDRIEKDHVLKQACTWLDRLIKNHNMKETVCVFFPEVEAYNIEGKCERKVSLTKTKSNEINSFIATGAKIEELKTFECKPCKKSFTGAASQEEHFKSNGHMKIVGGNNIQEYLLGRQEKQLDIVRVATAGALKLAATECLICKTSFITMKHQEEHLKSKEHHNKMTANSLQERSNGYYCTSCDKSFTGIESVAEHLSSRKHINKLEDMNYNCNEAPAKNVPEKKSEVEQKNTFLANQTMKLSGAKENNSNFYCSICDKSFTGSEPMAEHMKSKKHLNNKEKQMTTLENNLECKLCAKTFSGIASKEEHLKSKKHINKMREE